MKHQETSQKFRKDKKLKTFCMELNFMFKEGCKAT